MKLTDKEILSRLGKGEAIDSVCSAAGVSRDEFDSWWREAAAHRTPSMEGLSRAAVSAEIEIERDERGVPHIYAENDKDLYFGFGFAMAQDRLFQLDYLRRKATGRLSEILGVEKLPLDKIARTVGLAQIAQAEWTRLPEETQTLLTAFSAGVNAVIDQLGDAPPIEFDLLDYRPEPWSEVDCLAIESEFRWYLTGRFPVIVVPELAKRTLGDGTLYEDFLLGEDDGETILPPQYYPSGQSDSEPVGHIFSDPDEAIGSNNWVVAGEHSATGCPMVASDPHIAFEAVSCWYEVHLCGGSFNTAGMAYVGMPAILCGRNQQVAWGITNNICSIRDLYQEKTDAKHPGCFLYDGQWEPARETVEEIKVCGGESVQLTVQHSRNGPIVDAILPPPGDKTGPVSLKWLGSYQGGWLTALLASNRTSNVKDFRESLRPWNVPTFCLVFADVDGGIGMQSTGRIPIRKHRERGYRPGWDPEHQWQGLIPFEDMPSVLDPERGWMVTANNRLASDDYPYPLSGAWISGYRAQRIRTLIEEGGKLSRQDFRDIHQDALSLRATHCIGPLLAALRADSSASSNDQIIAAASCLEAWEGRSEPKEVAATIFNVFYTFWMKRVAAERFDAENARLLTAASAGIASRLLGEECSGWFSGGDRQQKIVQTFGETLDYLANRFGSEMSQWTWSKLHTMPMVHVLSSRGDLAQLLDHGGEAVRGDMTTVCNTGCGPDWGAATGAGFRMIAELSNETSELLSVDAQSQSGHPGSDHYSDQFGQWKAGEYYTLSLERGQTAAKWKYTVKPT